MAIAPELPPNAPPVDDSPLSLKSKRRLDDTEMDITPMIDIVFLLLIFFLVASKMDESASVRLPPARYGKAVAEDNSIVVLIRKGSAGTVIVSRRDGRAFASDIKQQEEEIGEYIDAGMTGSPPFDRPLQEVIVKAERDVKEGEVNRVAEAIGKVAETPILNYAVLEN